MKDTILIFKEDHKQWLPFSHIFKSKHLSDKGIPQTLKKKKMFFVFLKLVDRDKF